MFKFLDPSGCTTYDGQSFVYNLPQRGQKWARTDHSEPAEPDGKACGPGRLHLMKNLDAQYAPRAWWPWWARGIGLVGEDFRKASFQSVELRRITPRLFWACLQRGWGYRADLRGANLRDAYLRGANLRDAYLRGADLRGANLRDADLYGAYLSGANLSGADLYGANLSGANLRGADLSDADLSGARWNAYTVFPAGYEPPEPQ